MPPCEKCGEYTDNYKQFKWCRPCQINNLKGNFANWTSGNEKIDDFIQEMQLKIDKYDDKIFEWISYDQFSDIKEIGKDYFNTVHSAIWKNGPLRYDYEKEYKYIRKSDKKISLKCLHSSQNIT